MSKPKELPPSEVDAIRRRDDRLDGEAIHPESHLELIRELKADRRALLGHVAALEKINARANDKIVKQNERAELKRETLALVNQLRMPIQSGQLTMDARAQLLVVEDLLREPPPRARRRGL